MVLRAPKGIMDILPPESERWRRVQEVGVHLFRTFAYREIVLPVMEYTELFSRGIGQGTDIVQKEMFTFQDKAGRSLTLRPEATAGVVRAIVQNHMEKGVLPLKLYYQGPMFRHERPQAGRYRQFRQLGIELVGSSTPEADAEVIVLCRRFFEKLAIEVELVINSIGDENCRPDYVRALMNYLEDNANELCRDCSRRMRDNPLRVLDCKVPGCMEVVQGAPDIDAFLCDACKDQFQKVVEAIEAVGVVARRDARLVRGLDYYTRTVFELRTPSLGAQNAVAAGGRYDGLIGELGGGPTPAVGFSIGMERVMMAEPKLPEIPEAGVYVVAIGVEARGRAFVLAQDLRDMGIRTDLDLMGRSPKAQMREADRMGFPLCVILGEDEIQGGYFTLRDMESAHQELIPVGNLEDEIKRRLGLETPGPEV